MLVKLNIAPIKVYSRLSGIYERNKYIPYKTFTWKIEIYILGTEYNLLFIK